MRTLVGFLKLVSLAACIAFSKAHATDLGNLGKTYPIAEKDLVEVIKSKLEEKKANGELDKLNQELTDRSKAYVRRPPGRKLPRAADYKAFAIDPTYTVPEDIRDAEGNLLYPAGLQFNPLKVKSLTKVLCFIDGDDPEQVLWMQKICDGEQQYKLILVNGDYNDVTKRVGKRIYFDQYGTLVDKFRIEAVPAIVRQSGDYLYVEEFRP